MTSASPPSTASCSASRSVPCSDLPMCQSEVCSSRMPRKVSGGTDITGQARRDGTVTVAPSPARPRPVTGAPRAPRLGAANPGGAVPLAPGDVIAGYRVLRQIGRGGMGDVFLVQHPRLPRRDALKLLNRDLSNEGDFKARFMREA